MKSYKKERVSTHKTNMVASRIATRLNRNNKEKHKTQFNVERELVKIGETEYEMQWHVNKITMNL